MTRVLRDAEVRALLRYPAAVSVVADGVVAAGGAAERLTAHFPGGWVRVTAGTLPAAGVLGVKAFHLVPGAGVRYLCALYRESDGEPLALIDANLLTVMRTSAAAAAAAARHWGERPIEVAVLGSGRLARDGLRALASVCTITRARVYSPRPEHRERCAAELGGELELDLRAAESSVEATTGADMALCATETGGTVALAVEDCGDVAYISSVSSTLSSQRELDERTLAGATLVVIDTPDALEESGDLLAAREAGMDADRVVTLASYLIGDAPPAASGITVYKSIGSIEQDLALAAAAWRAAEEQERGELIASIETPRVA